MEFIIPLVIAAGLAYLYVSYKKSKKESASVTPEAPYKVEAPVAVEPQITDAVTLAPTAVKLRKPGTPKKAVAAKKPVVKTTVSKTAVTKKAPATKPAVKKAAPKAAPVAKKPRTPRAK
jgi:histone H1/5